jgi:hypothetical protein
MRTALCKMHISIDNTIMHDRVYIWNQKLWGESRIVGRQKESVSERQYFAKNETMALAINLIIGENIYGRCGRLI